MIADRPAGPFLVDSGKKARVFLVDDHAILRAGVARLIEGETDLTIAGEAASAAEALSAIGRLNPDLVVVDLSLVGSHGIDLLKDIVIQFPRLPVLILSMHEEKVYAQRCLQAGAKGYLMKNRAPAELIQAIRRIVGGGIYLSEAMTEQVLHQMSKSPRTPYGSPLEQLTNREMQVLEMLGQGCGSREIASALHISVKTVETYRENIKTKLSLKNAAGLVHYAVMMQGTQGLGMSYGRPPLSAGG
jgi:DNA-binding NarL/FixJ family response regulator